MQVFPEANHTVLEQLSKVDCIVYAMGSLFTSVCPSLVTMLLYFLFVHNCIDLMVLSLNMISDMFIFILHAVLSKHGCRAHLITDTDFKLFYLCLFSTSACLLLKFKAVQVLRGIGETIASRSIPKVVMLKKYCLVFICFNTMFCICVDSFFLDSIM